MKQTLAVGLILVAFVTFGIIIPYSLCQDAARKERECRDRMCDILQTLAEEDMTGRQYQSVDLTDPGGHKIELRYWPDEIVLKASSPFYHFEERIPRGKKVERVLKSK